MIGLVVVLLLLVGGGWVWMYGGLKDFLRAKEAIRALPLEQQSVAENDFIGAKDPYLYGGILAGVSTSIFPSVWVWGKDGLRYFRIDEYSVYSYFSVCNEEVLNSFDKNEMLTIDRSIDTDLSVWRKKVRVGQFITIMIARSENGGTLGNLREAKAHDWWVFLPTNIRKQCEN